MVRHTKHDLELPPPIFKTQNWLIDGQPKSSAKSDKKKKAVKKPEMTMQQYEQSYYGRVDKTKADYITETIAKARAAKAGRSVKVTDARTRYAQLSDLIQNSPKDSKQHVNAKAPECKGKKLAALMKLQALIRSA